MREVKRGELSQLKNTIETSNILLKKLKYLV